MQLEIGQNLVQEASFGQKISSESKHFFVKKSFRHAPIICLFYKVPFSALWVIHIYQNKSWVPPPTGAKSYQLNHRPSFCPVLNPCVWGSVVKHLPISKLWIVQVHHDITKTISTYYFRSLLHSTLCQVVKIVRKPKSCCECVYQFPQETSCYQVYFNTSLISI